MLSKIYTSITCLIFVVSTISAKHTIVRFSPVSLNFINKFTNNKNISESNSEYNLILFNATITNSIRSISSQSARNAVEKTNDDDLITNSICKAFFFPFNCDYECDGLNNVADTSMPNEQIETAKRYANMGRSMSKKNKLDSAEYYFSKAEKIYVTQNPHDSLKVNLYGDYSHLYYLKADFGKAQDYSLKMLKAAESSGDFFKLALANTMVAQLFYEIKQTSKSILYTRNAVHLLPKVTYPSQKNHLIYTIASRYLWHYQVTKINSYLDTSVLFCKQLLLLAKHQNDQLYMARAFQSLQSVAFEKGNLIQSLQLLDSAIKYTEATNYYDLRLIYFDKADILVELHQYETAQRCVDSVLNYDKIVENSNIVDAYSLLSKIKQGKGDYQKAFEYKVLEKDLNDSLTNVQSAASVAELEEKYNQAQNEKTIVDLAKQKQLYFSFAIAALLIAVIIALFLRQQALKNKKDILEAEQRLNRARMNPHFLFNALTSLQKIALTENDKNKWVSSLSKFSNIMRATLESTYKEYITIEQEIEFLYEYFEVQTNRFTNGLLYEILVDDTIEVNELFIPAMLIQPFVENSIEHGLNSIDYTASIQVNFTVESNELLITIKDNGKGLRQVAKSNTTHISRSNQIIQERIYLLNLKQKSKARYLVEEDFKQNGVMVKLYLPLLYNEQINLV